MKASACSPCTSPKGEGVEPTSACAYAAAVTGTSPRLPSASTSSPAARAWSRTAARAAQPGAPSRSKQASCGLTATQALPAASMAATQWARDGRGSRGGRIATRIGRRDPFGRPRPQCGRVRVQPEHDLTATLLYERRKPVGEMGQSIDIG